MRPPVAIPDDAKLQESYLRQHVRQPGRHFPHRRNFCKSVHLSWFSRLRITSATHVFAPAPLGAVWKSYAKHRDSRLLSRLKEHARSLQFGNEKKDLLGAWGKYEERRKK